MMNTAYLDSPIGMLEMAEEDGSLRRICLLAGRERAEENETPVLYEAKRQLGEYFVGKRKEFDLPLCPEGSAFDKAVWRALREIPFGELQTYGGLAKALGKPTASRAVGGGCGRNPLLIVVPCHRVVASDGKLTGFAAGMAAKRTLIALEGGKIAGDKVWLQRT